MKRLPLNFVQCLRCRHVWNQDFCYEEIPYVSNPNRMFNTGPIWQSHLRETIQMLRSHVKRDPTIVEIGCGDGHFLRSLSAEYGASGRYIGFDPNGSPESGRGVEFYAELFNSETHFLEYKPDLIVIRHVLEHLEQPLEFLQQLAFGATASGVDCALFAETPCIDNVFQTNRLSDFFYEHVSNFTSTSFGRALAEAGEVVKVATGYNNEVIYGLVKLAVPTEFLSVRSDALTFKKKAINSRGTISSQMQKLYTQGKSVAIWGGTGKAAAFIQYNDIDAVRFPLVVDSDADKVGTCVPGTGQEIRPVEALRALSPDVVIIPMHWRVNDILKEIRIKELDVPVILTESSGSLVPVDTVLV